MSKAVIPRQLGDDYQARFFWLEACRLFLRHTKVRTVAYELARVKSFDDVVTVRSQGVPDGLGGFASTDYFQIKFNQDYAGRVTCDALMAPDFIGASSVSLLERLRDAQRVFAPGGEGALFHLVIPRSAHPDDPLAKLLSHQTGALRLERLFDGTGSRSTMGKIRSAWARHMGLSDQPDLRSILRPLRIHQNADSLDTLRDRLNDRLLLAGFRPVDDSRVGYSYDDLIRKLHQQGMNAFTRDQLREAAERDGLWAGPPVDSQDAAIDVGIRSFVRWAEHMADETAEMLCLARHFDDRQIRDPRLWEEAVAPEVREFVGRVFRRGSRPYRLQLDTHLSIAFAAGYSLGPKSGVAVGVVQRSFGGSTVWSPSGATAAPAAGPQWVRYAEEIPEGGDDVALAISVTHDTVDHVRAYVRQALPAIGAIVSYTIAPIPSSRAVRDGAHARELVDELVYRVRQDRSQTTRRGRVHVFAAAPNGLIFFLGALGQALGPCALYEYDFDGGGVGAYAPSMEFPRSRPAAAVAARKD